MTDSLPTARTMLPQGFLCLLVWCESCHHRAPAILQAIIDAGRGDVPLKDPPIPMHQVRQPAHRQRGDGKDALGVQPWRAEAG